MDNKFDKEKATKQLSIFCGGIACIKVGSVTETKLTDNNLWYKYAHNLVHRTRDLGIVTRGWSVLRRHDYLGAQSALHVSG